MAVTQQIRKNGKKRLLPIKLLASGHSEVAIMRDQSTFLGKLASFFSNERISTTCYQPNNYACLVKLENNIIFIMSIYISVLIGSLAFLSKAYCLKY